MPGNWLSDPDIETRKYVESNFPSVVNCFRDFLRIIFIVILVYFPFFNCVRKSVGMIILFIKSEQGGLKHRGRELFWQL